MKYTSLLISLIMISLLVLTGCEKANPKAEENLLRYDEIFNGTSSDDQQSTCYLSMYFSFEDAVSHATNIFEGEFLSERKRDLGIEYFFRVKKQIKGTVGEEEVCVFSPYGTVYIEDSDISYEREQEYTLGETYLIIGERQVSVYYDYDKYLIYAKTRIPTANIENAKMYGDPLTMHAERTFADIDEMEEYITSVPSKYPDREFLGNDYIKSDDLELIARESDYLIQAEPIELEISLEGKGWDIYICRVTEIYKGDIEESEIEIAFFFGTVNVGEKYTVALSDTSCKGLYDLSSKHSLCTTQEQAEQMINAVNG